MENKAEVQRKRKPSRLVVPGLVKLLTNVGLTNLDEGTVREYRALYECYYGSSGSIVLSFLHKIGMTNLTDEQVDVYCKMGKNRSRPHHCL